MDTIELREYKRSKGDIAIKLNADTDFKSMKHNRHLRSYDVVFIDRIPFIDDRMKIWGCFAPMPFRSFCDLLDATEKENVYLVIDRRKSYLSDMARISDFVFWARK